MLSARRCPSAAASPLPAADAPWEDSAASPPACLRAAHQGHDTGRQRSMPGSRQLSPALCHTLKTHARDVCCTQHSWVDPSKTWEEHSERALVGPSSAHSSCGRATGLIDTPATTLRCVDPQRFARLPVLGRRRQDLMTLARMEDPVCRLPASSRWQPRRLERVMNFTQRTNFRGAARSSRRLEARLHARSPFGPPSPVAAFGSNERSILATRQKS